MNAVLPDAIKTPMMTTNDIRDRLEEVLERDLPDRGAAIHVEPGRKGRAQPFRPAA